MRIEGRVISIMFGDDYPLTHTGDTGRHGTAGTIEGR